MGSIAAGLSALGRLVGETDVHLEMPARSSGFDQVVQLFVAPPNSTSVMFECSVTPNHRYTTVLDAYYFGSSDRDEVLATTTALNASGTITVQYDPITPAPDVVFVDFWSDSGFNFTGCKAKTT